MPESIINTNPFNAFYKYGSVMIAALAFSSFLQAVSIDAVDFLFYLAAIIALALGVVHVITLQRIFPSEIKTLHKKFFFLTIAIVIISCILTVIPYTFLHYNYVFLSFQVAFLIPLLAYLTYNYYLQINSAGFKYWYFPTGQHVHASSQIDLSNTELVKFVLSKSSGNAKQTSFTLDAPADMAISQVFYNLINEHNKSNTQLPIEYSDLSRNPVGWLFSVNHRWLPIKRYLDPDTSLVKNNISSNQVIYAVRE